MTTNKFTVVIPARMHSTRLPHKMVLDLGGVPLVIRTAMQARKSRTSAVIVATDHSAILDICREHNVDAIMTKEGHNSGTDRVAEVAAILDLAATEIIVNVQGDEPLIAPELINNLAEFIFSKNAALATIAHPIATQEEVFNPNIVKVVLDKDNNALYFSRSPIPFYREGFVNREHNFMLPDKLNLLRHIGMYAYSVAFLNSYSQMAPSVLESVESLEQLRVLYNGHKIAVLVSNEIPEIGVDTLEDLQYVRQVLASSRA